MFPNSVLPLPAFLHFVESMPLSEFHSDIASSSTATQPSSLGSDTETHDSVNNEVHVARSKCPTRAPSYFSEYHCSLIPFTTLTRLSCPDPQPVFPTPYIYPLFYHITI